MARVSYKVNEWSPKKGKAKGLMGTYDAVEGNLDTLFDIHITHKSWGEEWWYRVKYKAYDSARELLRQNAKRGKCFDVAMACIDDLEYLMAKMERLDKKLEDKKRCAKN